MPSPFPGMDPYLEDPTFWPDFHFAFLNYWREALANRLPDNYEARIDEQIRLVERTIFEPRRIRPDIAVSRARSGQSSARSASRPAVGVLEPVTIPLTETENEEIRESRIEVVRRTGRELVTALELLSPTNKEDGLGYSGYNVKRWALLTRGVNLVELDLLVGGRRIELPEPLPPGDYYAFVTRVRPEKRVCDVYAWDVRRPLPPVPVPLRAPDPDVWVDLAEVFHTAYERGRYARSLDYGKAPPAPLAESEKTWAAELARGAGV